MQRILFVLLPRQCFYVPMPTKQVNVEIDADLLKRVKMDALTHDVTLTDFWATAVLEFLNQPIAKRRAVLERVPHKRMGRKLAR
jgi:hypothetical protein